MLSLRPFENSDAQAVISWIRNELSFYQWSAGTYDKYPIEPEDMAARYDEVKKQHNGLAYPLVLSDGDEVVGHLLVRVLDADIGEVRFGYIIVDSDRRGKGYGSKMLRLALEFARDSLNAKRVTLGVFENNPNAFRCYKAVGFKEFDATEFNINGELWKCFEMEFCFSVSYEENV